MSQYTSYYLYQKYEKIGEQEWQPCYPNIYSISGDSEIVMPLVMKSSADTACGYIPPSEPIYRWVNLDPSVDYYCSGTTKYYKQQRQVSYNSGQTWENLVEYQMGASAETHSIDCGAIIIYKWVNLDPSVDYYCSGTTKFYKQQKQISYNGGQTWEYVDEYQWGNSAQTQSEDCGYVPPIYRWVNLDPSVDYYCSGTTKYYKQQKQVSYDSGQTWDDVVPAEYQWGASAETHSTDCGAIITYRWVDLDPSVDYYCSGTTKYYKQQKQVSYDDGQTWENVVPPEYQWGNSAQTQSEDCGYVPPIYRWVNMDISSNWICDECTPIEPIYRWVDLDPSVDYYCSGTTKYYKQQKQVSYDSGQTWDDVVPAEYQWGASAETQSTDCGYVPPSGYSNQYLTFVAREDGTFKFSGNSVSYSLDSGSTWTTLASDTDSPTVQSGNSIMWKATLTPSSSYPSYGIGRFISSAEFDVEGNAMSLLYGDNFSGETSLSGKDYAFYGLFSGNTNVVSTENLALNATTLGERCYSYMFGGCTALTTAPELPATTLTLYCYYYMFYGCTSLEEAPRLSATTLANSCYHAMFQGCTSLTRASSELPATTLTDRCYQDMFNGCTALTTAPELPATTLTYTCYRNMFRGCTSLNYIKCLATNISASNCTLSWVDGVASSGTFVKNSSMNNWTRGANGIPNNWTVIDA